MHGLQELVWMTQLGISVSSPLLICILGSVWLRNHFDLGAWIIFLGLFLGLGGAISAGMAFFRHTDFMAKKDQKDHRDPPVSFNEHE